MSFAPTLSVAPMMDWTDRHCRFFHRLLAPDAVLYSEMVTTGALLHGDVARHLRFNAEEHPVALQLGGAEPDDLARCAALAQAWGYDEVNLNCGCPSDRVQRGRFGACLMLEPETVAACVAAMRAASDLPVTVKCRIGVDDQDDEAALNRFIATVAAAGCEHVIVHARKAWLQGLSPKQNREVPPLRYAVVERLKAQHPDLTVVLNGGITTPEQAAAHLAWADGVMIGRAAYQAPHLLPEFARALGLAAPALDEAGIVAALEAYAARVKAEEGVALASVTRHVLGLFNGRRGAKAWRRALSEEARRRDDPALIGEAYRRYVAQEQQNCAAA